MLTIDKASPVPMYRQLKARIREAVDSRVWPPGYRLPSERQLIESLSVSRITVRQALRELVAEGHLASANGKGFFVADRSAPQELDAMVSHTVAMTRAGITPSSRVLACEVRQADDGVAANLRLRPGDEVVYLSRLRLGNGLPLTVQEVWLPHRLVPGLTSVDFTTASLFEELRLTHGLNLARAETVISARLADATEANLLELADPPITLVVDQNTFDDHGTPLELSRSLHHPSRMPVRISQEREGRPARREHGFT